MNMFRTKRKPLIITTDLGSDDDDNRLGTSKRLKLTSEHKTSRVAMEGAGSNSAEQVTIRETTRRARRTSDSDEDSGGPVVIKPPASRSGSLRDKTRTTTHIAGTKSNSRLSFASNEDHKEQDNEPGDDSATRLTTSVTAKPARKLRLGHQAFLNSMRERVLPTQLGDASQHIDYTPEYLEQLQKSTPSFAPSRPLQESVHDNSLNIGTQSDRDDLDQAKAAKEDVDSMELDISELEGAMIVDESALHSVSEKLPRDTSHVVPRILTQTEIDERKARRRKLAEEIPEAEAEAEEYISLSEPALHGRTHSKKSTRLVDEDADGNLGEGFDDFVEDGGISLGKRAERERRRRRRKEMAEQILEAEKEAGVLNPADHGNINIDDPGEMPDFEYDSEAERAAMFEDAQTRAGMSGLRKDGNKFKYTIDSQYTFEFGGKSKLHYHNECDRHVILDYDSHPLANEPFSKPIATPAQALKSISQKIHSLRERIAFHNDSIAMAERRVRETFEDLANVQLKMWELVDQIAQTRDVKTAAEKNEFLKRLNLRDLRTDPIIHHPALQAYKGILPEPLAIGMVERIRAEVVAEKLPLNPFKDTITVVVAEPALANTLSNAQIFPDVTDAVLPAVKPICNTLDTANDHQVHPNTLDGDGDGDVVM